MPDAPNRQPTPGRKLAYCAGVLALLLSMGANVMFGVVFHSVLLVIVGVATPLGVVLAVELWRFVRRVDGWGPAITGCAVAAIAGLVLLAAAWSWRHTAIVLLDEFAGPGKAVATRDQIDGLDYALCVAVALFPDALAVLSVLALGAEPGAGAARRTATATVEPPARPRRAPNPRPTTTGLRRGRAGLRPTDCTQALAVVAPVQDVAPPDCTTTAIRRPRKLATTLVATTGRPRTTTLRRAVAPTTERVQRKPSKPRKTSGELSATKAQGRVWYLEQVRNGDAPRAVEVNRAIGASDTYIRKSDLTAWDAEDTQGRTNGHAVTGH